MTIEYTTQPITQPGVYPLGLVSLYFDLWVDRNTEEKKATIVGHYDNGGQHLDQRFFFFDRGRFSKEQAGHSLRNTFIQQLQAGLAPEAIFPLLALYDKAEKAGGYSESLQEEMALAVQDAARNAREIIEEKGLAWPSSVPTIEDWGTYIDGGKIEGKEFPGWASMLVDKIYAVFTVDTLVRNKHQMVIPQKKEDLEGIPFVILPLWWGPGTGVQVKDPDYKLPYTNMTPEEWVEHSKTVRAEIETGRKKSWTRPIGKKGYSVMKEFGKLGFGGGSMFSGVKNEEDVPDLDTNVPTDEEDVPF
jgi:hypothetical protein